jgi:class 3 adenylate cyclase
MVPAQAVGRAVESVARRPSVPSPLLVSWARRLRSRCTRGPVTFLLTDVEASTRLWQDRGDEMKAAMARQGASLDEAIAATGGVRPVEQGGGDSLVAAFARPVDAVDAAVSATCRSELPC